MLVVQLGEPELDPQKPQPPNKTKQKAGWVMCTCTPGAPMVVWEAEAGRPLHTQGLVPLTNAMANNSCL